MITLKWLKSIWLLMSHSVVWHPLFIICYDRRKIQSFIQEREREREREWVRGGERERERERERARMIKWIFEKCALYECAFERSQDSVRERVGGMKRKIFE
jgi:hypothetical protein